MYYRVLVGFTVRFYFYVGDTCCVKAKPFISKTNSFFLNEKEKINGRQKKKKKYMKKKDKKKHHSISVRVRIDDNMLIFFFFLLIK